jgi:cytoskeleton protein RodZ
MVYGTERRFGEELRRERLVREVPLEEISAATKISLRMLKALEDSDISRLPAPAFTRGFIRSYALHLGIDPDARICDYMADLARAADGAAPSVTSGHTRFWRGRGTTAGTIVGGVTALLLLLGLIARPARRPAPRAEKLSARSARVELKNVTVSNEPTPLVRQAAAPVPVSDTLSAQAETDPMVSLVLEFDQDSWTKLSAGGQTLFMGLIRKGEVKRFQARGGFRLSLGNAGGVRVTIDGRALESLGRAGEVVRDLRLPARQLRG